MNIEITRGDTKKIKFKRKLKDGTEITQDIDEIKALLTSTENETGE